MEFVQQCARAAGVELGDVRVDHRGLQHLVLIDEPRGVVFRFPRRAEHCASLGAAAERLAVLADYDLPTPRLLDVTESADVGTGHLAISYCPGEPLDTVATDALPFGIRQRLAAGLVDVVARIRSVPRAAWPVPGPEWSDLWAGLERQMQEPVGLPPSVHAHHADLAHRAAQTAAVSPSELYHGDLGGVNCRIDPSTGAVTGILDWDSAAVGDPATDVAAVLAGIGPRTGAEIRRRSPLWEQEEQRYLDYVETWPIQYYLWSRHSSEADREQALAMVSRLAATARR